MSEWLRHRARLLGGEVVGRDGVICPGPLHSKEDRSLSVRFESEGRIIVNSFCGDDWKVCRDHVLALLGGVVAVRPEYRDRPRAAADRWRDIWAETIPIDGSLAGRYLRSRGLTDATWVADLRFHPRCPFGPERLPCMVALYRDILTNQPRAIHRTALSRDGTKIDRKALGPKRRCAIKLSEDAEAEARLTIAEGIETALASGALRYRPIWALGDANGIENFPVLSGIESLSIIVDNDVTGTGQRVALACSKRWTIAGREVFRIIPNARGADFADLIEGRAA